VRFSLWKRPKKGDTFSIVSEGEEETAGLPLTHYLAHVYATENGEIEIIPHRPDIDFEVVQETRRVTILRLKPIKREGT
jgi:hypothetical protein